MSYTQARVVDDHVDLGKKVAAFGIAALAAGMMVLAAPAEEALAVGAEQTDATTTSVSATLDMGSYYMSQNPVMNYAEAAVSGSSFYERVETSVLTPTYVVVNGLDPATEYTIRLHFTYGGRYDSTFSITDLCTVAGKATGLQVGNLYPSIGQMGVRFNNPGTIYGYEVELDAFAGKKYDKTIRKSYGYGHSYSKVIDSDAVKMNVKTAYKARVRTYVEMDNGHKAWSEWSDKTVLVPQPNINTRYYNVSGGVKVSWAKCSGAKSYTLYGSTKDSGFKKIGTVKGTSMKVTKIKGSKLKKGKKYYLYVQANVPSGSKTYTSKARNYVYFVY